MSVLFRITHPDQRDIIYDPEALILVWVYWVTHWWADSPTDSPFRASEPRKGLGYEVGFRPINRDLRYLRFLKSLSAKPFTDVNVKVALSPQLFYDLEWRSDKELNPSLPAWKTSVVSTKPQARRRFQIAYLFMTQFDRACRIMWRWSDIDSYAAPLMCQTLYIIIYIYFKNSLIIQEENTNKNHKCVVSLYVIKSHVNLHKL